MNIKFLEDSYDDLVELIYQIPIDNQAWQKFCRKLMSLLDVTYIHMQALDFRYNVLSYSNGVGSLEPEQYAQAEVNYLHYPKDADPRWVDFLNPQRTGWYQCHNYVTDEFVTNSEFYQNILLPNGLRYVATHDLIKDETLCVYWSLSTSVQRGPLNEKEIAYLDRFNKHLKRVSNIQRRIFEYSATSLVGYELIDRINQPIMLINLSGQVIHSNLLATKFLKDNVVITIKGKHLVLPELQLKQLQENLQTLEVLYRQNKILNTEALKDSYIQVVDQNGISIYLFMSLLVSEQEQLVFGKRPLVMLNIYHPKFGVDNIEHLYRVFDRINTGVLLIDRQSNVFYKNLSGKRILEHSNLVNIVSGYEQNKQLKFRKPFQEQFSQLLSNAYKMDQSNDIQKNERELLTIYDENEVLVLNIIPITQLADLNLNHRLDDVVAVFIRQPSRSYLLHDLLKQRYKLTNRELEICDLFINKMNLDEIAEACSVTRSSLRTYMKNIFAKLEVSSQAEMMHLLLSLSIEKESYNAQDFQI